MKEDYFNNQIFYKKNIKPKGDCIVFIHGIWGSSSAWIPYEKRFEKDYSIISIDLRGHGKSFRPKRYSEYALDRFAEDIYGIIKKEKIQKIILVANSFGNFIALEFMDKYPKIVKKAILISPHYNLNKIKLTRLTKPFINFISKLQVIINPKQGKKQRDYEKIRSRFKGDWDLRRSVPDIMNTGLKSSLISLNQVYNYNASNFLTKIKIPILIVHGKKDTVFPLKYVKEMASKIKNCWLEIIDNGNHIMVLNNFKELTDSIEKYLRI